MIEDDFGKDVPPVYARATSNRPNFIINDPKILQDFYTTKSFCMDKHDSLERILKPLLQRV